MKVILYRILGNDLPPRHATGQTLANLEFILRHEAEFPGVEKRWLLNRIVSREVEEALATLIRSQGQRVDSIPFRAREYLSCWPDVGTTPEHLYPGTQGFSRLPAVTKGRTLEYIERAKNLCLMNNNGARNTAIALGLKSADWVLPWDGGCFLTADAWQQIRSALAGNPAISYLAVPMARVADNNQLLVPEFSPGDRGEPQLGFSRRALEHFDPSLRYGSMPKAMLIRRMGVPGPWQSWRGLLAWEQPVADPVPDAGAFVQAGWVARLAGDGEPERLATSTTMWTSRFVGIRRFTHDLDHRLTALALSRTAFRSWPSLNRPTQVRPGSQLAVALAQLALEARQAEPWSVVHKSAPPEGGTPNHYWTPAPYWHSPAAPDQGQVMRDGVRRADAVLYSAASEAYDRSRFQRLVDACCTLAVDFRLTGNRPSLDHGARLVRCWFIDPATRMLPDARFAQTLPGSDNRRRWSGIVEFRDLYPLLDALTILRQGGAFTGVEEQALTQWLRDFTRWLLTSPWGHSAAAAANNLGTWYNLVVGALAAQLGDEKLLYSRIEALPVLLARQFAADGSQPLEAARTKPLHYALFNLQAWANLATLCRTLGRDLWAFSDSHGRSLASGVAYLQRQLDGADDSGEIQGFRQRLAVLSWLGAGAGDLTAAGDASGQLPLIFHPDTGVPQFWWLARGEGSPAGS